MLCHNSNEQKTAILGNLIAEVLWLRRRLGPCLTLGSSCVPRWLRCKPHYSGHVNPPEAGLWRCILLPGQSWIFSNQRHRGPGHALIRLALLSVSLASGHRDNKERASTAKPSWSRQQPSSPWRSVWTLPPRYCMILACLFAPHGERRNEFWLP